MIRLEAMSHSRLLRSAVEVHGACNGANWAGEKRLEAHDCQGYTACLYKTKGQHVKQQLTSSILEELSSMMVDCAIRLLL